MFYSVLKWAHDSIQAWETILWKINVHNSNKLEMIQKINESELFMYRALFALTDEMIYDNLQSRSIWRTHCYARK